MPWTTTSRDIADAAVAELIGHCTVVLVSRDAEQVQRLYDQVIGCRADPLLPPDGGG